MQGQAGHFNFASEKMYAHPPTSPSPILTNRPRSPYAINRYTNETKRLYGVLETQLEGKEYLLGTYGIADIKTFGWVRAAPRVKIPLDEFPRVKAWVERIEARPAVQAGIAIATPPKKD